MDYRDLTEEPLEPELLEIYEGLFAVSADVFEMVKFILDITVHVY